MEQLENKEDKQSLIPNCQPLKEDIKLNVASSSRSLCEIKIIDRRTKTPLTMLVPELYKRLLEGKSSKEEVQNMIARDKEVLETRDLQSKFMNGLHFASLGMNVGVLQYVLEKINKKHAITVDGYTALHTIVIYGDTNHSKFHECFNILLEKISIRRDFNNEDVICIIKEQRCANAYKAYLEFQKGRSKEIQPGGETPYYRLFRTLREGKEPTFIHNILTYKYIPKTDEKSGITLLQLAVYKQKDFAVDALLHRGVNPNENDDYPITPLDLCIEKGDANCFKLLIMHPNLDLKHPEYVWKKICELGNVEMIKEFINSNLIEKTKLKTILPFSLLSEMPQETILTLLEEDVMTLADKDDDGCICAAGISKTTLSKHLNSCIKHIKSEASSKNCFEIKYELNYKTLMPTEAEEDYSEVDLFMYISDKRPDLQKHLLHDLVKYFILLKWHKIQRIFFFLFGFHSFWCALLIFTIIIDEFYHILSIITLIAYFLWSLISILQKYFHHKEINYTSIVCKLLLLIILICSTLGQDSGIKGWNILSAASLILCGFELLRCAGQYPKFSTVFCIFQAVLETFLQYLLFYSILIIPFAISFYVLFKDDTEHKTYNNPLKSIFKALIMLSGEIDTGAMPFHENPFFARAIVLSFEIVVVITLINLLNGLAVGETNKLQDESELNAIKVQLHFVNAIERLRKFKNRNFLNINCHFFESTDDKKIEVTTKLNTSTFKVGDFSLPFDKVSFGKYTSVTNDIDKLCPNRRTQSPARMNEQGTMELMMKQMMDRLNQFSSKLDRLEAKINGAVPKQKQL